MNILYIAHESNLGGATLSLLGMIDEALKEDKHKVHVLVNYNNGELIEELKKRNIKFVYKKYYCWMIPKKNNKIKNFLRKNIQKVLCLYNYICVLKLYTFIRKYDIEIIHTNSSVVNIGAILSRIYKLKHVWHIREFGEEDFNFQFVFNRDYSFKFMEKYTDKFILVSKALYNKYSQYINKNKLEVIYNGINEKYRYKKTDNNLKNEKLKLLISGRVCEAKGHKEAILALNELITKGYENIELNIVGSGEIEKYENFVKSLDLQSKVKFHGRLDNLFDLRKDMDIELVCSRCEAFGRVTVEAMMSSIPVIGSNTGGTKELIKNGYNGYLYRQGDYKDLSDKILNFISNENEIEKMSRNAYQFTECKFTSKINYEDICRIYEYKI